MTQATFQALTISAGDGTRYMETAPGYLAGKYRRKYQVRVKSDATDTEIRFDYHGSVADEQEGKTGLGPDDLLWAFYCFVSDADAGTLDLADFLDEFGYTSSGGSSVREGIDTHKGCRRSLEKFDRLYHVKREPADVIEALQDAGVE